MKIGILETGVPPEPLQGAYGSYPDMFARLLREAGLIAETVTFDVQAGALPAAPEACDAYLITGSPAGVYDPLPWIEPLKGFLRQAKGRSKLVGICFGHQIMAEAFGGRVIKSPKGWGVGLHRYDMRETRPWTDAAASIAVPVSHQDQVVDLPPGARVIAGSAFTPYGVLEYDDQPAISLQHHPEFLPDYATALVERRRGTALGQEQADAAVDSLKQPNDTARVGGWIRRFLES